MSCLSVNSCVLTLHKYIDNVVYSPTQTQPSYLAQLIFLMPQNKSTRFMETVIFTLFNYGSDFREAYLLLQLFTAALRHEIKYGFHLHGTQFSSEFHRYIIYLFIFPVR